MTAALKKLQSKYGVSEGVRGAEDRHQASDDRRAAGGQDEGVDRSGGRAAASESRTPAWGWRDSESVFALRLFLECAPELRAQVGLVGGHVALHFDPPLDPRDADRWHAACEAEMLLRAAREDLRILVASGAVKLRVIDHRVIEFE